MDAYQIGRSLFTNRYTHMEVFEGVSQLTGEHVIVKTYTCESIIAANNPLSEGLVQSKLAHPNICRLIDIRLTEDGTLCKVNLVMEKLDRDVEQDIRQRGRERRPYSEMELLDFLLQIGSALAWGKKNGFAHRDVKPENVLLDADGRYKLCDFGASWKMNQQTLTNSPAGTLLYMSPQMRLCWLSSSNKYNPYKADVYSLGVTLLHLALLAAPISLNTIESLDEKVEEVLISLSYSDHLKGILRRMLEQQEEQRPFVEEVLETARRDICATVQVSEEHGSASPALEAPPSPVEERKKPGLLASVQSSRMALFSLSTRTWQRVHLSAQISVNKLSSFLVLSNGTIFCCGGNYLQTACIIRQDGHVSPLVQMRASRSTPGVIQYEDAVYVFGGSEATVHLKTNELYSFAKGKWLTLPDMQTARASFNPCQHSCRIFLCGGFALSIEIFDPTTKRFFTLSGVVLPESSNTTAVFEGNRLVILTNAHVCYWSFSQRAFEAKTKDARGGVWSSCSPVTDGKYLYTLPLLWHQTCICRDLATGHIIEDIQISN